MKTIFVVALYQNEPKSGNDVYIVLSTEKEGMHTVCRVEVRVFMLERFLFLLKFHTWMSLSSPTVTILSKASFT